MLQSLIPAPWVDLCAFARLKQIRSVPATSVQLWFDRRFVERREFTFVVDSPMVIFQEQATATFPYPGSRISCQVTDRSIDDAADEQIIDLVVRELHRHLPESVGAQVQKSVVVRHRAFAMEPGTRGLRPAQASPIPNFFLAGDYTRHDWFTTMEGAALSGELAAYAILDAG